MEYWKRLGVSEAVRHHLPCPSCGSSDARSEYTDHYYCFSCNKHEWKEGALKQMNDTLETAEDPVDTYESFQVTAVPTHTPPLESTSGAFLPIPDRNIKLDTCKKYGVTVKGLPDGRITHHYYPYYTFEGVLCANKVRIVPTKEFHCTGKLQQGTLFGMQSFPKGCAKYVTLFEGELDAMSGYQLLGSKYPCLSIKDGASSAARSVKRTLEYLESFERIYLCFDNDEQGIKATEQVAGLFTPGKVRIVHLEPGFKDASDYLQRNLYEQFTQAWWKAETWTPDGIIASSALRERIKNRESAESVPFPWEGVNAMTYGIRKGEMVVVTAKTGIGKTQILREMLYHIHKCDPSAKIGTMFLEEVPEDSGLGLMSIEAGVQFHLPDSVWTQKQWDDAFEKTLADDSIFFYDAFGSRSIDNILSRVRFYAKGLDCKYVFIDHLSIIVSDQQNGDERKALDEITTKLKMLAVELGIALITVVHLNREGQIRGSAGIEQLCNTAIMLERDTNNADRRVRNTTHVSVFKNRFAGRTGPACDLFFDETTGRLREEEIDAANATDVFN